MRTLLFVYGTLMQSSGHPMSDRLAAEADLVGRGSVEGRLYDLGPWPGLVPPQHAGERVHGEVWQLRHPRSLVWLDRYEGIGCERRDGEYERIGIRVSLEDGGEAEAFAYVYRKALAGAARIAAGKWRAAPTVRTPAAEGDPARHNQPRA